MEIEFRDDFLRTLDFEPFIQASVESNMRSYLDEERFKGFSINYGNLVWNDYDLCFSLEDLYSGNLLSGAAPQSMVVEEDPDYGNKQRKQQI